MIEKPSTRLYRDSHPLEQPQGTYTYALNAVNETQRGDKNFISTERGFSDCLSLSLDPIGYVNMGNDEVLLFLTNDTQSEIGVLKKCTYTKIYDNACLNFNRKYPVQATYRLRRGCDRTVYFTDGQNPVRVINVDQPPTSCDDLNLVRGFTIPCISKEVRNFGGSLKLGSYEFAIRYTDASLNPTAWFYTSRSVHIYDEPTTAPYIQIDGGFNAETDPVNGVTSVAKSISLSLSGLDSTFSYYQIGIISRTSGTGDVSEVLVSTPQPIQKTTFVFNGSTDGYTSEALESVQIKPISVETAAHIEQLENRLILANIKGKVVDYADLQRAASLIETKYTVKQVRADDVVSGNAKHPNTDDVGYMGDEVYSLGIVYVFDDGWESPAFHIPGRPSNSFDVELLTVTPNGGTPTTVALDDVKHLGLGLGQTVERYKVFNTADTSTQDFAYHQNTDVYPDIRDCNGNSVWGLDAQGNELIGTPIRHHKFPDRKKAPVLDKVLITAIPEDHLNVLGVEFSGITYPLSNIVGHYIVRGDRQNNKTVLDKGILRNITTDRQRSEEPQRVMSSLFSSSRTSPANRRRTWQEDEAFFMGTRTMTEDTLPTGSHFKFDYLIKSVLPVEAGDTYRLASSTFFNRDLVIIRGYCVEFGEGQQYDYENRTILGTKRVGVSNSSQPSGVFTEIIRNRSSNNPLFVAKLDGGLDEASYESPFSFLYTSVKSERDVYTDLFNIEYKRTHDCVKTGNGTYFGGDTYLVPFNTMSHYVETISDGEIEGIVNYDSFTGIWVESEINLALRNDKDCEKYLRQCGDALTLVRDSVLEDTEDGYVLRASYCQYPWQVNPDLSSVGDVDSYFPLPLTYDYCSRCTELFPNRIAYSSQSFQEELSDNYRLILANNYRDIEGEFGRITAIARRGNEMLIWTPDTLFLLPASLQERVSTSGVVTYIGSGSFFEIPPRIVSESETGSAGTLDKWAIRKTEQGIFFLDSRSGTPYLFSNQLQPLDEGMRSWFEEQTSDNLGQLVNIRSPYYWGATSVYDLRHERWILTYKDYALQDGFTFGGLTDGKISFAPGIIAYDTQNDSFYTHLLQSGLQEILVTNNDYFCDKSWTMSFNQGWTSWHSYTPEFYITSKTGSLAYQDGKLQTFNSGQPTTYFGVKYPHIVEFVLKADQLQTALSESLTVVADSKVNGVDSQTAFFNKLLLYNSRQTTGIKNMTVAGTISPSNLLLQSDGITVTRRRRNWQINGFRDYASGALFLSGCTNFRQTDKQVASLSNPNWFELERLDDKFVVVRLIYDGSENVELTTQYGIINNTPTE